MTVELVTQEHNTHSCVVLYSLMVCRCILMYIKLVAVHLTEGNTPDWWLAFSLDRFISSLTTLMFQNEINGAVLTYMHAHFLVDLLFKQQTDNYATNNAKIVNHLAFIWFKSRQDVIQA